MEFGAGCRDGEGVGADVGGTKTVGLTGGRVNKVV